MFSKGDWIVYNCTGVCRVEAVGPLDRGLGEQGKAYYTLRPERSRETIYIPVDSGVYMRRVITRQEAEDLLARMPEMDAPACTTRDLRALHAHYRAFLQTHTCEDLVRLIKSARAKSRSLAARGIHPRKIDQEYQKQAEELLYEELSVALEQPYEQVAKVVGRQVARA